MRKILLSLLLSTAVTGLSAAVTPGVKKASATDLVTVKTAAVQSIGKTLPSLRPSKGVEITRSNGIKQLRLTDPRHVAKTLTTKPSRAVLKTQAPDGYVLFESFEGWDGTDLEWSPEGWTIQRSGNVSIEESWTPCGEMPMMPAPADGKYFMGINYNEEEVDEWIISPEVEVPEGMQLSYWAYVDPLFLFALDNVDWDTFEFIGDKTVAATLQTWVKPEGGEWTMLHDFAEDWTDATLDELFDATPSALQKFTESIEPYWGQKIQVGFRYVGIDGNTMFIDAIGIGYPVLDDVMMLTPFETLYWGFEKGWEMSYLGLSIAQYPVYAPLSWQNYSDNEDATYSWTYSDPATGDIVTSDEDPDMLTLTYEPDYTSAATLRNNLFTPPVLNAEAPNATPAHVAAPYELMQAGGKAEYVFADGSDFEASLLPFNFIDLGLGITTVFDDELGNSSIPVFGYDKDVDAYWLNYSLNGEEPMEGDYSHLTGIANLFMPSATGPVVVRGVNVNAYGKIEADAELTMTIYGLNEEMSNDFESFTVIASAKIKGSDILAQYPDSKGYLCLPFLFDEPVALASTDEHPAYFFMLEGFRSEAVEYFAPIQNATDDIMNWGYMMVNYDISGHAEGAARTNIKPLVYKENGEYVDPCGAFAFGLVAEYPWLTTDCTGIKLTEEAPDAKVALGSYYDGAALTVSAPAGVTATVSGRYDKCVLSVSRDDSMVVVDGDIKVSGPGVEVVIPIEGSAFTGIESISASESTGALLYDLSGRRLDSAATPGVYVVKHSDGRVEKVVK